MKISYEFHNVIIISLLLSLISCHENDRERRYEGYNRKYSESLSFFKDEFISHFPKKLNADFLELHEMKLTDYNNAFLYLMNQYKQQKFDSLKIEIKKLSKISYGVDDKCLLVINKFKDSENWYKRIKLTEFEKDDLIRECYNDKLPVPNFYETRFVTNETKCKLPKDFRLYVLDSQKGKYWEKKYLYGGKYMPKEWKNGFSKGFAVSDKRKIIIYWFSIW